MLSVCNSAPLCLLARTPPLLGRWGTRGDPGLVFEHDQGTNFFLIFLEEVPARSDEVEQGSSNQNKMKERKRMWIHISDGSSSRCWQRMGKCAHPVQTVACSLQWIIFSFICIRVNLNNNIIISYSICN